jgi:hypothetical protein
MPSGVLTFNSKGVTLRVRNIRFAISVKKVEVTGELLPNFAEYKDGERPLRQIAQWSSQVEDHEVAMSFQRDCENGSVQFDLSLLEPNGNLRVIPTVSLPGGKTLIGSTWIPKSSAEVDPKSWTVG